MITCAHAIMAKRMRSTPSGKTPLRPTKRQSSISVKKMLFPNSKEKIDEWSRQEEGALVEFVMLTSPEEWPVSGMKEAYWESAATFVYDRCHGFSQRRTSKLSLHGIAHYIACRWSMLKQNYRQTAVHVHDPWRS